MVQHSVCRKVNPIIKDKVSELKAGTFSTIEYIERA